MGHGSWKTVQPAPSLAQLKKHHTKYGHDKRKDGFGKFYNINYKTWKQAQSDSLIEVAVFFLKATEVLTLLRHMDLAKKVIDQAKEEFDAADELRKQTGHPERGVVSESDGTKQQPVQKAGTRRRDSRSSRTRSR